MKPHPVVHIRFYQVPVKVERHETALAGIIAASRQCARTGIGVQIQTDHCHAGIGRDCARCRDYWQIVAERKAVTRAVAKQWKCSYFRSPQFWADRHPSIIVVARGELTEEMIAKARNVRDAVMKKFLRFGYTAYVDDDRGGTVEKLPSTKWKRRTDDMNVPPWTSIIGV